MDHPLAQLTTLFPAEVHILPMLKFIGVFAAISLLSGLLVRIFLGKHTALNHAVSSAMGILLIYVVTVVIDTFHIHSLSRYLSPLPFVRFSDEYLHILSFRTAAIPVLCQNILSLLILAFLVNLIDRIVPKGKTAGKWYLLRFLSVALAIGLHYAVNWASHTFLPGVLVTYAPMILIGVLVAMFLLGVLNVFLSLLLTAVNPIIGGIYAFFFSNKLGRQLSKSILTTIILCGVFYALEHFGYGVICISAAALISYLPLLLALLLLWYLIGHLL